jgi:hypothetical protein
LTWAIAALIGLGAQACDPLPMVEYGPAIIPDAGNHTPDGGSPDGGNP